MPLWVGLVEGGFAIIGHTNFNVSPIGILGGFLSRTKVVPAIDKLKNVIDYFLVMQFMPNLLNYR